MPDPYDVLQGDQGDRDAPLGRATTWGPRLRRVVDSPWLWLALAVVETFLAVSYWFDASAWRAASYTALAVLWYANAAYQFHLRRKPLRRKGS